MGKTPSKQNKSMIYYEKILRDCDIVDLFCLLGVFPMTGTPFIRKLID
jgi:hypothetical protein